METCQSRDEAQQPNLSKELIVSSCYPSSSLAHVESENHKEEVWPFINRLIIPQCIVNVYENLLFAK